MKLRDFVGQDQIHANCQGQEDLEVWDSELTEEDVQQLSDPEHMAKLEEAHTEFQAYMTFRHGSSKYHPRDLAKHASLTESHIWAYLATQGRTGKGLY